MNGTKNQAEQALFNSNSLRPSPQVMKCLIEDGLDEPEIIELGKKHDIKRANIEFTLYDLETYLPAYQLMSDVLADKHKNDVIIFAGRDAEVLYDDFSIRHSKIESYLMPSSKNIWSSDGMKNDILASRFFDSYGLNSKDIKSKDVKYVVVDTGFKGSVVDKIDDRINRLYGVSMRDIGSLAIKLVCADSNKSERQIMDMSGLSATVNCTRSNFDLGSLWCDGKKDSLSDEDYLWNSIYGYWMAMTMEKMPRYSGAYRDIIEVDGQVKAISFKQFIVGSEDDELLKNDDVSFVNPVAAARVQYRVVKEAVKKTK